MKQKRKSLTRTISAFEAFEFVADEFASAVRFKRSHVDVVDSKSMLTLVIERTRNKGKLVVHYLTNDGTARAGENYVAGSGAVTFYHGEKLAQIKIKLWQLKQLLKLILYLESLRVMKMIDREVTNIT